MKAPARIILACAAILVGGCTTPPPYAIEPLPPANPQDGTCFLEVKAQTIAGAFSREGTAEIVGFDRRTLGKYTQQNTNVFVVPAGKREIVFRWNRGRDYAQSTADCELPRDAHLILRAKKSGDYVDFWFEDQATGTVVDRKHVGAVRYGVFIPLPILLP